MTNRLTISNYPLAIHYRLAISNVSQVQRNWKLEIGNSLEIVNCELLIKATGRSV